MRVIYRKIRHARYLYIKRNVEKVWGARYTLGARYLSKNTVFNKLQCTHLTWRDFRVVFRFRIQWLWRHEHKVPDASISSVLLPLFPIPASAGHTLVFNYITSKTNYNNFILCSAQAIGTSRQFNTVLYYWLNSIMYTSRLTKIYCDIRGITANCELIIPVSIGDTYPWRHFT